MRLKPKFIFIYKYIDTIFQDRIKNLIRLSDNWNSAFRLFVGLACLSQFIKPERACPEFVSGVNSVNFLSYRTV